MKPTTDPAQPGLDERIDAMTTKNRAAAKTKTTSAKVGKKVEKKVAKTRGIHPLVFGQHAYCAVSRAIGLRGTSPEDVAAGYTPWTVAETSAVFAAMNPPILPAKGSVAATLRDKRVKGAELSTEHWARLDRMRAAFQRQAAKADKPARTEKTDQPEAKKAKAAKTPTKSAGRKVVAPASAETVAVAPPTAETAATAA